MRRQDKGCKGLLECWGSRGAEARGTNEGARDSSVKKIKGSSEKAKHKQKGF